MQMYNGNQSIYSSGVLLFKFINGNSHITPKLRLFCTGKGKRLGESKMFDEHMSGDSHSLVRSCSKLPKKQRVCTTRIIL
jgi:hypothetical protein